MIFHYIFTSLDDICNKQKVWCDYKYMNVVISSLKGAPVLRAHIGYQQEQKCFTQAQLDLKVI